MRIDRIKLVTEMLKQNINQKMLSERTGISRSTVNYIVGGKSCSYDSGKAIAKALGVDVTEIIED